jgi:hypothetical protein
MEFAQWRIERNNTGFRPRCQEFLQSRRKSGDPGVATDKADYSARNVPGVQSAAGVKKATERLGGTEKLSAQMRRQIGKPYCVCQGWHAFDEQIAKTEQLIRVSLRRSKRYDWDLLARPQKWHSHRMPYECVGRGGCVQQALNVSACTEQHASERFPLTRLFRPALGQKNRSRIGVARQRRKSLSSSSDLAINS